MAKAKKSRADKYDEKLKISGSFTDVVRVSVKNADKHSEKKKEKKKSEDSK